MSNDLIYIYCISNSPLGNLGNMMSKNLKTLFFDNFFVIVKYVSENEFSEEKLKQNISDVKWLESNARDHINVINMVMEFSDVIPFKFGTIFQTNENLRKFIFDYSDSLKENFQHNKNKEEWAVKIYCDRKVLCEQIDELSGQAAELEKQIMASSPGKAYLLKRKKADLIENEIDLICKKYGQVYFDEFKNMSEYTFFNNLLPKEYTGRQDTMILNSTFLVNKSKVADFKNVYDKLKQQAVDYGFNIEVTGPWPPFSFISIKEK